MSFWDFSRSPASVRLLVEFGRAQGILPARLLTGTRLTLAQLDDPNRMLSAGQELRVISNLLRQFKSDGGIGLQVGLHYHLSTYGILGYGLISSANGAEALALARQFLPLTFAYTVVAYKSDGISDLLQFEPPAHLPPTVQRFVVERAMGAACRLLSDLLGDEFELTAFRLSYPNAGHIAPATPETVLGARIELGTKTNSLSFQHVHLLRALPQANPVTVAMCKQMCAELIDRRRMQLGTAAFVRDYLDALPSSSPPELGDVAGILNVSERTLKRWLQRDGTSFRELLAASRHAKADALLTVNRLSLTEVAEEMGFSDLSTFSQAYKRWTGKAPSLFRKNLDDEFTASSRTDSNFPIVGTESRGREPEPLAAGTRQRGLRRKAEH